MSYQNYIGKTETATDTVWPPLIRGLAAALDIPETELAPDGRLPPLAHWMLFQEWTPAHGLGEDGHPHRGGFMPPVHDLPRRMWAGGRVRFLAPLNAGQQVTRVSTILQIEEKTGASGRLNSRTVSPLGRVLTCTRFSNDAKSCASAVCSIQNRTSRGR